MNYYPLHLCLAECAVVVVGAGAVGQRKISGLLKAQPNRLVVIDPALSKQTVFSTIADLCSASPDTLCTLLARSPEEKDFQGATLAFAATDNPGINQKVFDFCKAHGVLCNRADGLSNDFIVPALTCFEDICITISTGGASPALSKQLRLDIEALMGRRYTVLCKVLKRIRPLLLALDMPTDENSAIFRKIVQSALGESLVEGNSEGSARLLKEILPAPLHSQIAKVLYDI